MGHKLRAEPRPQKPWNHNLLWNPLVADKIKIEKVPTSSVEKTDVLIGFSVVELPKNSLQMLDSGKFWSIFSILKIEK